MLSFVCFRLNQKLFFQMKAAENPNIEFAGISPGEKF